MSFSDTANAKKYASIAEVAAAECKLLTEEARKAPQYTNQAKKYAEEAEISANSAVDASAQARDYAAGASDNAVSAQQSANIALQSEQEAQASASSASASEGNAKASEESAAQSAIDAQGAVQNTLRVTDGPIPALPEAADRALKVLTCDASGNFQFTTPSSGSAADVLNQLSESTGSDLVGYGSGTVTLELDKVRNKLDGGASFSEGAILKSEKDFIWDLTTKAWYYWTGTYPKDVPAASTPDSTGGVVDGAWVKCGGVNSYQSTTYYVESIDDAKSIALKDGDVVKIGSSYFNCRELKTRNSRYPVIVSNNGIYLYVNDETSPSITGAITPKSFIDFTKQSTYVPGTSGQNLPQGLQGIEPDSVNGSMFVYQLNHGSANPATGSMFEYNYDGSGFGTIVKEAHNLVLGHGDAFSIYIRDDGGRTIIYPKPTDNGADFGPSTICSMDWDSSDPKSTIQTHLTFDKYIGVTWYDENNLFFFTHSDEYYVVSPEDVLSGLFRPVRIFSKNDSFWTPLVRAPKQQLKHFLGRFSACSGGDVSNEMEAYVCLAKEGQVTSMANIYTQGMSIDGDNLPWGEIEGLTWFWDGANNKYQILVGVTYPDLKGVWFFDVSDEDPEVGSRRVRTGAGPLYGDEPYTPDTPQGGSNWSLAWRSPRPLASPMHMVGGWRVNEVTINNVKQKVSYELKDFYITQHTDTYNYAPYFTYGNNARIHAFNFNTRFYPANNPVYGGSVIIQDIARNINAFRLNEQGGIELNLPYGLGSSGNNDGFSCANTFRVGLHSRATVCAMFYDSGALAIGAPVGNNINFGTVTSNAGATSETLYRMNANSFLPFTDFAKNLGTASNRWHTVYAATGTINTSDRDAKDDIADIEELAMDAAGLVSYKQYKFKESILDKGNNARIHFGVIAQDIKDAFEKVGLDAFKYGVLCYDEWGDEYETIGEERDAFGDVIKEGEQVLVTKAGKRYGVRYDEWQALESAYQRREIEKLKAGKP